MNKGLTTFLVAAATMAITSCNRYLDPNKAARGPQPCGKHLGMTKLKTSGQDIAAVSNVPVQSQETTAAPVSTFQQTLGR